MRASTRRAVTSTFDARAAALIISSRLIDLAPLFTHLFLASEHAPYLAQDTLSWQYERSEFIGRGLHGIIACFVTSTASYSRFHSDV